MKFKFSNKSWIILSTAILIGIAFSIYFLVYVKGKEKTIIANNFRVLQQVVQNIKSLEVSYSKNADIRSKTTAGDEINQNLSPVNDVQKLEASGLGDKKMVYGKKGIFFQVDSIVNPSDTLNLNQKDSSARNFYFTDYKIFYKNDLFLRKDVFDQIIITKIDTNKNGAVTRSVLFSNVFLGIMDSAYYTKTFRSAKDEITINENEFVSFNQSIDDESKLYISGLVLKLKFEQQKRSVSPFVIFNLSIAVILIILLMPLLKLKIMNREERLYIRDVMYSVISVLIGPAVFMIFLYTSLGFFGKEKIKFDTQLESLSVKIENNFQQELQRMVYQIDDLNVKFPLVKSDSKILEDTFTLSPRSNLPSVFTEYLQATSALHVVKNYRVFEDVVQKDEIKFNHLKAAFWSDNEARLLILLSAFHDPGYAQDLKHRKYLTNIIDQRPNFFKDLSGRTHEIAIESIKSVTDGSYEVGVGKLTSTSDNPTLPVMAISAKISSVMEPVLEEGFGFCILDKDGNTMFHSDIKKNMNENFISETNEVFRHSIMSHTNLFKTIDYNGINQAIYFRPMHCLSEHYIATFVNSEVLYGPFTLSMISTFILFICYLMFVLLVYLVLYYSTFSTSKLNRTVYMLNFLRPYETEIHFKKYKRLILVSSVVILYLILSSIISKAHYDFLISDLIIVNVSLLIFSFYSLSVCQPEHKLIKSGFGNRTAKGFVGVAIGIILFLLIRTGYFIIDAEHGPLMILNSLASLFIILLIISENFFDKKAFKFDFLDRWKIGTDRFHTTYKIYLVLWVIILSIIPVNLFLRITSEKEDSISAKYRSYELLTKINDWEINTREEFRAKFAEQKHYDKFVNSMQQNNIYLAIQDSIDSVDVSKNVHCKINHNPYFSNIYEIIRPTYNARSSVTGNFNYDKATDSAWFFRETSDTNIFTLIHPFGQSYSNNQVVQEKSNFFKRNWYYIIMITIISIILLIKFLSFTLDKIFGFRYKKYAVRSGKIESESFTANFMNPNFFSNDSSFNNIFIVAINSSNTSHIKNELIKQDRAKFFTLDFYDFDETNIEVSDEVNSDLLNVLKSGRLERDWKKIKGYFDQPDKEVYILIEHFEYGYNDLRMNKLKLEALKYLVDSKNFKVLISSEINAAKLLDFYEDSIKKFDLLLNKSNQENRIEMMRKRDDLKVESKKWQHLLGNFVNCIIPIHKFAHEEELANGEYQDMIKKYLGNRLNTDLPDDDKILTIQQMSYPYYYSVWNSLTKDERYIVYDIARDSFVNTINTNGIMSLLDKGILVYDHSIRIMNESFANFVLTKVNSDEALEMEMESRKKGTWNTAFAVIFLLIISLVIFLSIGQQNFLDDINAFLTAIIALIGILIRFSGFLSFGGTKSAG